MKRRHDKHRRHEFEVRSPADQAVAHMGRVKWFNPARGYGFVVADDARDVDVFLHHRNIQVAGYRELVEGQRVRFTIAPGPKGPVAYNVLPIRD